MRCAGAPVYLAGRVDIPSSESGTIVVCAGGSRKIVYWGATRLLCWSLGSNKVCLQGPLDIPSAGAWQNCGMCWCFVW